MDYMNIKQVTDGVDNLAIRPDGMVAIQRDGKLTLFDPIAGSPAECRMYEAVAEMDAKQPLSAEEFALWADMMVNDLRCVPDGRCLH